MPNETAESIFREVVIQEISRFIRDDSLKTVDNFICYLDHEAKRYESHEIKCGRLHQAEDLHELWNSFRLRIKMEDLTEPSDL